MLTDVQIAALDDWGNAGPAIALAVGASFRPDPRDHAELFVSLDAGRVPMGALTAMQDGDVRLVGTFTDQRGDAGEIALHRVRFALPCGHLDGGEFFLVRGDGTAMRDDTGQVYTVSD